MPRLIALLLTSIVPATLFAGTAHAEPRRVDRDGYRFEYSTRLESGDRVRIEGRTLDTDEKIRLMVEPGGRVRGDIGSRPVSFAVGRATTTRLLADLKSEHALAQSGVSQGVRLGD